MGSMNLRRIPNDMAAVVKVAPRMGSMNLRHHQVPYLSTSYKMSSRNVQKILNKNVQFNSSRIILDNVLQAV